ncbi:MAG: FAD-dependent oxidoreductase [Chitinophagales bacterium]
MKYIIIGAVAGGASAAARLRRLDEAAAIVLFEKGAYISYANCGLPYYIGEVIEKREKLFVQTAASFNQRFRIDVRIKTEILSIDPKLKKVTALRLDTGEKYEEHYDKLILSPGAEPIRPPLPGISLPGIFTLRNVADTDLIKAYVDRFRNGKAVVVGAGFIGLEMAENLHALGMDVTIIEMGNQILAPLDTAMARMVENHVIAKGVHLKLEQAVSGFSEANGAISVMLQSGETLPADVVMLSIGVRADTRLAAAAGLRIGEAKGIWVNEYLQTSDASIYAVGDAIEFPNPITGKSMNTYLAGPANKQGRICANNVVLGNQFKYEGAINTAIVKVFDLTVGSAGMASKHLKAAGMAHQVSITHSGSHAGYYPGAQQMSIQLAFSPSGSMLGAQVVGYEGADKRLDVLSGIIQNKGNISDLTDFEHAYAPPYSSAKDPVNIAGFVAENILTERVRTVQWDEIAATDFFILDVRTAAEFAKGALPHAVNIPVDTLRGRLSEIPNDRKILVYCQVGLRGYLAYRILAQCGYNQLYNLSGGYTTWSAAVR